MIILSETFPDLNNSNNATFLLMKTVISDDIFAISCLDVTEYDFGGFVVSGREGGYTIWGDFIIGGTAWGNLAPQWMQNFIAGVCLLHLGQRILVSFILDKQITPIIKDFNMLYI